MAKQADTSRGILPSFGAYPAPDRPGSFRFSVWAPEARTVELVLTDGSGQQQHAVPMVVDQNGVWSSTRPGVTSGLRYWYRVDGEGPWPDPASRSQPDGVHKASQVVVPSMFSWTDSDWMTRGKRPELSQMVIYELHIGTFTPEGTFLSAIARLPYLKDLGVTTVEIMPVNDFPGQRNWGYDGVSLYAPARCYGSPDDLRRLVDAAHRCGLAVMLDVVYNHLGPDGNYLSKFSPYYFSDRKTAWGNCVNIDPYTAKKPEHALAVRRFFIENAVHWLGEYHIDGLRLDATHELIDSSEEHSEPHFLAELVTACEEAMQIAFSNPAARPIIVAEDDRNCARLAVPRTSGGLGLSGLWADDFHHQVRVMLAGDRAGYYENFEGTIGDLVRTIEQGWFFVGQADKAGKHRGTSTEAISQMCKFIYHIQNHDQIGNRAMGDRLNHKIDIESYKAASALLLLLPQTPMLFMGQEWAASSIFAFFTDHNPELGKLVTEGRRREFAKFPEFSDPKLRETIPDPQAESTFQSSKLWWDEIDKAPHAEVLSLYRDLLRIRQQEPALRYSNRELFSVVPIGPYALAVVRRAPEGQDGAAIGLVNLRGQLRFSLREFPQLFELVGGAGHEVRMIFDSRCTTSSGLGSASLEFDFAVPGVCVLKIST
eukprot:TRINITY_DN14292_c0_g1_i1.p1 TRINITY_DN14292_c0_g1~~TRINITY_DN14292_c0_g1_i1.p1  ORF type:complete len:654 (+),score=167.52 TRINITY_DN14292_c0_g1_i1:108-2069(+)